MKYGSVCSGIEAASVAWESLGWQAQWYSEIEHFPSAVLAHRFPAVPNLGDMTQIHNSEHFNGNSIDLLVGGTPCQSFSVAGLRKGLDDTRGQLMLTFCELAARKRPRWVVWENVPGVLSSNKGEDLASFLGLLTGREIHPPVGGWKNSGIIEGIGSAYGVAWTVLDAQYFGVAQRRRRIFAVGYLGDCRPAAAVLFEYHRLSGNSSEGRKKRKATSSDAQGGFGGSSIPKVSGALDTECSGGKLTHQSLNNGHLIPDKSKCVMARQSQAYDPETETMIPSWWNGEQTAATLTKQNANGAQRMPDKDNFGAVLQPVAHAFKVRGGSEDNTGEQGGILGKKAGKGYLGSDELAFTIGTTQDQQIAQPIAYSFDSLASNSMKSSNPHSGCREVETSKTLDTTTPDPSKNQGGIAVAQPIAFQQNTRDEVRYINGDGSIAGALSASSGMKQTNYVAQPVPFRKVRRAKFKGDFETWEQDEKTNTLNTFDLGDIRTTQAVVQPIAVDVYNQSIDGQTAATITEAVGGSNTSGPKIAQPIAVDTYNYTTNESTTQTIRSQNDTEHIGAVMVSPQAVDFRNQNVSDDVTGTLQSKSNGGYSLNYQPGVLQPTNVSPTITQCKGSRGGSSMEALDEVSAIHAQQPTMAIRRLTPTECERLQGFPDGWTKIPYRNKPEDQCPDGPRYKACGNSMAVPVMRWIGQRIQMVEDIL